MEIGERYTTDHNEQQVEASYESGGTSTGMEVRKMVKMDAMQYGLAPENRTTDAVYFIKQMQQKCMKKGSTRTTFCRPGEGVQQVPREVTKWAVR